VRDLIDFLQRCDLDGTDRRRVLPELDKALDKLGVGEGSPLNPHRGQVLPCVR
jgi:hypothetical protein